FVLASRGLLQLRRELEQRRFEDVNAGIVPRRFARSKPAFPSQLLQFGRCRLLDQPLETKGFIEKVQPSLGHVFSTCDSDHSRELAPIVALYHLLIRFARNQDVAVGQKKCRRAQKMLRDFRRFASAILHLLPPADNSSAPLRSIAEIVFDYLSLVP